MFSSASGRSARIRAHDGRSREDGRDSTRCAPLAGGDLLRAAGADEGDVFADERGLGGVSERSQMAGA